MAQKAEPLGATQEAHLISYCCLLSPREIAKLFGTHEMVGRGGGDRIQQTVEFKGTLRFALEA